MMEIKQLPISGLQVPEHRKVLLMPGVERFSPSYSPTQKNLTRKESLQDVLKAVSTITIDYDDQKGRVWNEEFSDIDSPLPSPRVLVASPNRSPMKSVSSPTIPVVRLDNSQDLARSQLGHTRTARSRSEDYRHSWDYSPTLNGKRFGSREAPNEYEAAFLEVVSSREESGSFFLYKPDSEADKEEEPQQVQEQEEEQVIFTSDSLGKKGIKAASADFLIRSLVEDTLIGNYEHVDIIILTHTMFTDSHTLLSRLIEIYESNDDLTPKSSIKRARVVNAIKKWIRFNDIRENVQIVENIHAFIQRILQSSATVQHPWALQVMKALESVYRNSPKMDTAFPRLRRSHSISILRRQPNPETVSFCDIDPCEFSRHITAGDWKLFSRVSPSELIDKAWSSENKAVLAPNIVALIDRFNKLCFWVATEIVSTIHPKQRITVLERFIDIAKGFLQLHNFHALVAMFTAFNMNAIQKLKHTWKGVSKKHLAIVKQLDELFDSRGNFRIYRAQMKNIEPPVVPFEGIMLTDVTFIYENEPTHDGLFNFERAQMLGEILRTLKTMQNIPYRNLTESQFLRDFMGKTIIMNEDQICDAAKSLVVSKGKKVRSRTLSK